MKENMVCSWSGGKDSCYALMQAVQAGFHPKILLNVMNEEGVISRSHGLPVQVLEQQAFALNIPLYTISSSWQEYEDKFTRALIHLKNEYQLTCALFGDIDLQAHRDWEEKVCAQAGLSAILPLWQNERKALVLKMLLDGVKTIIVSCNSVMGAAFIGKMITPELIEDMENMGIDPCGENGEFHTLVLDCPLYKQPINICTNGVVCHEGYWFAQSYDLK